MEFTKTTLCHTSDVDSIVCCYSCSHLSCSKLMTAGWHVRFLNWCTSMWKSLPTIVNIHRYICCRARRSLGAQVFSVSVLLIYLLFKQVLNVEIAVISVISEVLRSTQSQSESPPPTLPTSVAAAFISHRTIHFSLSSAVISTLRGPRSYSPSCSLSLTHRFKVMLKCFAKWESMMMAHLQILKNVPLFFGEFVINRRLCDTYSIFFIICLTLSSANLNPETSAHTLIDCYLSLTVRTHNTQTHSHGQTHLCDTISSAKALQK